MGLKVYLPVAVVVFLAATMGAGVIASTSWAGEPLAFAVREYLNDAAGEFIGTMLLLAPFIGVAFVCSWAETQARSRTVFLIFSAAMLALFYFYFQGHEGAERALLQRKWTAAALSIGLLPFFIGVPVVFASWCAAALASKFDRRTCD